MTALCLTTVSSPAVNRGNPSPVSPAMCSGQNGSQFSIHSDLSSGTIGAQLTAESNGELEPTIVPMRLDFEEEITTSAAQEATPTTRQSSEAPMSSPRHRLVSATAPQGDSVDENDGERLEFRTPLRTLTKSTSVQLEPELKRNDIVGEGGYNRDDPNKPRVAAATPSDPDLSRSRISATIPETV